MTSLASAQTGLTLNVSNTTYGTQVLITATANNSIDTVKILINGSQVATGTNTTTFTICSASNIATCYAAQTYNVTANDTNASSGPQNVSLLTINPATPALTLTVPGSYAYSGAGGTITYAIATISNQVVATLNVNGVGVGTTTTNSTYTTNFTAQSYNALLNSPATTNYSAASTTATFQITGALPPPPPTFPVQYTIFGQVYLIEGQNGCAYDVFATNYINGNYTQGNVLDPVSAVGVIEQYNTQFQGSSQIPVCTSLSIDAAAPVQTGAANTNSPIKSGSGGQGGDIALVAFVVVIFGIIFVFHKQIAEMIEGLKL